MLRFYTAIKKNVLGESSPSTLKTINDLGVLYDLQGKHKEAEVILKQCLEKRKVVFGENHPDTLDTKRNLGYVYKTTMDATSQSFIAIIVIIIIAISVTIGIIIFC